MEDGGDLVVCAYLTKSQTKIRFTNAIVPTASLYEIEQVFAVLARIASNR